MEVTAFEQGCSPRQILVFMTSPKSYKEDTKWNRIVTEPETSELWSHISRIGDNDDLGNFCQWLRIREWFIRSKDFITLDYTGTIKDMLNIMRVGVNPNIRSLAPVELFSLYIHDANMHCIVTVTALEACMDAACPLAVHEI